jgi:hypothetical protein
MMTGESRSESRTLPSVVMFCGDVMADGTADPRKMRATFDQIAAGRPYIVVGNMEIPIPLAGEGGANPLRRVAWRAEDGVASILAEAGFAAVCYANNHATSWSEGGLVSSLHALQRAGVMVFGAGLGREAAVRPAHLRNPDVVCIGLTCTYSEESAAQATLAGVNGGHVRSQLIADVDKMSEFPGDGVEFRHELALESIEPTLEAVRLCAEHGHYVVVFVHWGVLYASSVDEYQLDLAERLINAGARLIVGSHPHVIGPVGGYRDGVVLFSAGNAVWSPALFRLVAGRTNRSGRRVPQWSRIGLVAVLDLEGSTSPSVTVEPVVVDGIQGLPHPLYSEAEASSIRGWLNWLGANEIAMRPGWCSLDLMSSGDPASWFPLGYRPGEFAP